MSEQNINKILEEREKRYGDFGGHADITQYLKYAMRNHRLSPNEIAWEHLDADECEALEMIAHKIGRILNGDPHYVDSWDDIAGYATLVANRLRNVEAAK